MIMVRVIGLENSLRVQTRANTRKYMQVNANKSDSYLLQLYEFASILWQSHHVILVLLSAHQSAAAAGAYLCRMIEFVVSENYFKNVVHPCGLLRKFMASSGQLLCGVSEASAPLRPLYSMHSRAPHKIQSIYSTREKTVHVRNSFIDQKPSHCTMIIVIGDKLRQLPKAVS